MIIQKIKEKIIKINQKNKRQLMIENLEQDSMGFKAHFSSLIKKNKTVAGYIPFAKDGTNIIIYNFFSINYGFRSKGKMAICLTDKQFKPLITKIYEIDYREIIDLHIENPDLVIEPVFCIIIIGYDQMRVNHGGHGGHLRFWGAWNRFSAFSHSMPLPGSLGLKLFHLRDAITRSFADRRIYPANAEVVEHYGVRDGKVNIIERGDLSGELRLNFGYSTIRKINSGISSCFHNSPYTRKSIAEITESVEHVVAVPPVENIEIFMYFGECCTLGSKFIVGLHTENHFLSKNSHNEILYEKIIEITSFDPIKLSDLFPNNLEIGKLGLWLIFKSISGNHRQYYINTIYGNSCTKEIFDGVHSHNFADSSKIGVSRSLKFAPFVVGKYERVDKRLSLFYKSILAIWGDNGKAIEYRLRIFSKNNKNFEKVFNLNIKKKEVNYIILNEYIDHDMIENNGLFVAQIESEQQNLNANLYCIQMARDIGIVSIAVDHLTGG
jgi:hypothetical protein